MFAVIKTGGKQYLVKKGDVLEVEKLNVGKKKETVFKEVLLVSDDKSKVKVGNPTIRGAKVEVKILEPELKAKKVRIVKFKPKKRYKRTLGHRQRLTRVKIEKIVG